jgi:hypothetical protein
MEPYKQGDLDGLCGIYSIINAVRLVHKGLTDDDCDELFQKAFICLERRKVIRDGKEIRHYVHTPFPSEERNINQQFVV